MHIAKSILEKAWQYESYTAENLSKLVKKKSLSCYEKEAAFELIQQMEQSGFDEVRIDGLGNVIGRIGFGKRIIAFDGHIDTVDAGNLQNWSFDPFSGEIKDGFVHGRGTVDQKGGPAAFVTAGRIIKELDLAKDITIYFIGSVIEEDCDGLPWKYIIEEDKIIPECVVITEPTNLGIYRGHRGRMEIEVTFKGRSAHGSAPERGLNAVYMASGTSLMIKELNNNLADDEFLGKGSVAVTEFVSNSPSLCAIPDYSKIHLDRRLTWGEDKNLALEQIKEIVKNYDAEVRIPVYKQKSFTGLEYGMEKYYPTWKLEPDNPYVHKAADSFKKLFNTEPVVDKWTFSTNGVVICGIYGIPVVGFGPGNEVLAHAPDEKVPVEHLVKASAFYAMLSKNFNE
jgi:putative selenium metabolism hydrolase